MVISCPYPGLIAVLNDSSDKGFNTGPANTVAFRQGSNVEFEGPSFVNTGHSGGEVRNRKQDKYFAPCWLRGRVIIDLVLSLLWP